MVRLIFLLVLSSSAASAQDKLTLPKELRTAPGRLLTVVATTEGKKVLWRVPEQIEYRLCPSGKELTGVCLTPGRYTLTAITAIGDEPIVADCVLIVDSSGPVPPPNPGPSPPPIPDQLQIDIQRLYTEDQSATKSETSAKLASLYRLAATTVAKPEIETAGQLAQVIRDASTTLVGAGLLSVRRRVAEELGRVLPTDPDAKLTPEVRDRASKLFNRLSTICEGLKQ